MRSVAKTGILSLVIPSIANNRRQMSYATEIVVVTLCFAREKRMQGVMKIIAPLRRQSISALFARKQNFGVVQIALRYRLEVASKSFS